MIIIWPHVEVLKRGAPFVVETETVSSGKSLKRVSGCQELSIGWGTETGEGLIIFTWHGTRMIQAGPLGD